MEQAIPIIILVIIAIFVIVNIIIFIMTYWVKILLGILYIALGILFIVCVAALYSAFEYEIWNFIDRVISFFKRIFTKISSFLKNVFRQIKLKIELKWNIFSLSSFFKWKESYLNKLDEREKQRKIDMHAGMIQDELNNKKIDTEMLRIKSETLVDLLDISIKIYENKVKLNQVKEMLAYINALDLSEEEKNRWINKIEYEMNLIHIKIDT